MDAYLIDLGNVLVGFDHRIFCHRLAAECRPWHEDDIHRLIFRSGLNKAFETGRMDGEQFYREVRGLLNHSLPLDRFQEIWCDIFWELPGMGSMLGAIHQRARLILVSNTNPWHIEYTRKQYSILEHFDEFVLSFEIGAVKPDPKFYEAALKTAGAPPERCLYLDDVEENVRIAARLGIPSAQFRFLPG